MCYSQSVSDLKFRYVPLLPLDDDRLNNFTEQTEQLPNNFTEQLPNNFTNRLINDFNRQPTFFFNQLDFF